MDQSPRRRAVVCQIFFAAIFVGLVFRLYAVQVLSHDTEVERLRHQSESTVIDEPPPGPIFDRNGLALALSSPVEGVWVNPSAIVEKEAAARALSGALGMPVSLVQEQLSGRHGRKFVLLRHRLSPEQLQAVRRLQGEWPFRLERRATEERLGTRTEYQRLYPNGSVLGSVVGHDSLEPGLREGLERSLSGFLHPAARSLPILHDGRQQRIGSSLAPLGIPEATLTIDLLLQKVVEEELDAACAEHHPRWATAIVMNPKTGEVLAIANRPTYDPNKPGEALAEARLDRAITFPYEPGSTLKPFTAAYALDQNLVRPDTIIDCEGGVWHFGPRFLHDHEPMSRITLAQVIIRSSNIGAAKIGALILGSRRLYDCMKRWGFGDRTGVDLPAEDSGLLFPLDRWTVYSATSIPMGHEISVTPIQLCTAMSAIANGGTLLRPYVVRRVVTPDGVVMVDNGPQVVRRVIGESAAREMVEILEGVVREGTGKKAAVAGLRVAGKTGTAQKIDPRTHQYTHERYDASFVGFAPADDPKICIAVVLDEPQGGSYYGGAVAAPVVGRIIQRGLVYAK